MVAHAEPAAEARLGGDAVPGLADQGDVEEARGVVRQNADEDLLDEVVCQRRRRHAAAPGWTGTRASAARVRKLANMLILD